MVVLKLNDMLCVVYSIIVLLHVHKLFFGPIVLFNSCSNYQNCFLLKNIITTYTCFSQNYLLYCTVTYSMRFGFWIAPVLSPVDIAAAPIVMIITMCMVN